MNASALQGGARKFLCVFMSLVLAVAFSGFSPSVLQQAWADDDTDSTTTDVEVEENMDVSGYVTAASYRAAEPTPEILGLSNVATNTAWQDVGELDWSAPYYYIFATSTYNSNPNPYMCNAITGTGTSMVLDQTRSGGPTASLGDYTTSQVVWDLLPDVILGNNKGYNYNSEDYSQAAAEANDVDDYKTYGYGDSEGTGDYGVVYDSTNIYTMIESMYNLAAAGEEAAAGTGKSLRYGSAMDIAQDFEEYVKGIQGYVLEQIAENSDVSKKTVALVTNYDEETDTYTCTQTGVSEGTAAANRYLEAVQFVATNIADEYTDDDSDGSVTISASDLESVDLVLVGSQSGSETLLSTEDLVSTFSVELANKTYYMSSTNGSAGSCYGVVMNSVENAQNIGRILGCLYDEVLDQSDLIAYYYENFYHVNTGTLAECIDNAMDGVRNWDVQQDTSADTVDTSEALLWSESTVADYSESEVQAIIDEGVEYIADNSSSLDSTAATYLAASSSYSDYYAAEATEAETAIQAELDAVTSESSLSETATAVAAALAVYNDLSENVQTTYDGTYTTLTDAVSSLESAIEEAASEITSSSSEEDIAEFLSAVNAVIGSVELSSDTYAVIASVAESVADDDSYSALTQYMAGYAVGYTDGATAQAEEDAATVDSTSASYTSGYEAGYEAGNNDGYTSGVTAATAVSLSRATVTLSYTSKKYTGSSLKPTVKVTYNGTTLTSGTDYTVTYLENKSVGTAYVVVAGAGDYNGMVTKTFKITKASQSLKVTKKTKTVKYSKVKKAKQTVKAITKVSGAKGTVTYKKTSGSSKLSVNSKTGKVTVKKGTKKGTYKIKVKVTSKATSNYKSASKTVTVTVKVK